MLFEGGATASFTMNAFTPETQRETRICGSLGELRYAEFLTTLLQCFT